MRNSFSQIIDLEFSSEEQSGGLRGRCRIMIFQEKEEKRGARSWASKRDPSHRAGLVLYHFPAFRGIVHV